MDTRKSYKTDVSDEQWQRIAALLPPARLKPGCDPTDLREVLNAILYQNHTGCQWDMLPHDLPPKSTVWDYFARWQRDGTWQRVVDALRVQVREAEGRPATPRVAAIDSPSVPTTATGGEQRGIDGGKKVKGRKRHIVVDSLGLLIGVAVTAANVCDGTAAPLALCGMTRADFPRLERIYADSRYNSHKLQRWLEQHGWYDIHVVSRPPEQKGFVLIPRRWVVERTFAWFGGQRRLCKDYERTVTSSEARVRIAAIQVMLQRLKHVSRIQAVSEAVYGTHESRKAT